MVHITHRIGIQVSIDQAYNAISTPKGISKWWTEHTSGFSEIGKVVEMHFHSIEGKELGHMEMEILALKPNKKVHWKCLVGPEEWIGTEICFELFQEESFTIVRFTHANWKEEVEFKAHCSMKWAVFLISLKQYLENGSGQPAPHDFKIDNWN